MEFEKYWKVELKKQSGKADIKIALAKSLKTQFIIAGVFYLIEGLLLLLIQPIFMSYLAPSITEPNNKSIGYSMVLFLSLIYWMFNLSIANNSTYSTGLKLRVVCTTALFKKAMRLQQYSLNKISIGQ